ncbi:hypothetical protein DUI87_01871 [Hirundo rustica rustica]|uniref:Uncharacterized protein n=1 Tax=Hirundo rustica rustica TaxID=333673 RepID=A0A3M0L6Q0_HIRRU|nr:hypothetical protein DUI87_01871 [Hirundo rustica rustica]
MPSRHVGAESVSITGVTGGSQDFTLVEADASLTGKEWEKQPIVTGPEAPCILGIDYLRGGYFKDPKGLRPGHELQPGSSAQGLHIPYNKPHLLKPNFRDLSSTFIYTVLESSAARGSNFYNWRTTWKTPDPAFQAVRDFPMDGLATSCSLAAQRKASTSLTINLIF